MTGGTLPVDRTSTATGRIAPRRATLLVTGGLLALSSCRAGPEPGAAPGASSTPGDPAPRLGAATEAVGDGLVEAITSSLTTVVQIEGEEPRTFTLAERMAHHRVPGVSAAYFDEGEIVWARAWGVKDSATGEPLTTETLFQAASISKPVTALTMLTLVEDGTLDLNGNVNDYMTRWRLPDNDFTRRQPVTLKMVAAHGAGLTVRGFLGYAADAPLPTTLQILDGEPPANSDPVRVSALPGSIPRYSGGGYVMLGLLLEDVVGAPLAEIARTRVLRPAGMRRSLYAMPLPAEREAEATTVHDADGRPVVGRYHLYPEMGAGGLWTTPTDLARLAIAVQRSSAGAPDGILSPEMTRQMLTSWWGNRGLGFSLDSGEAGVTAFRHGGANKGIRNLLFAHVAGDGMVVMTNGVNGGQLWREIFMAAGRLLEWDEWQPEVRTVMELSRERRAALVGRYQILEPVVAEVVVELAERGLDIHAVGFGRPEEHFPASATTFFAMDGGNDVRFELAPDGSAAALTFGNIRAARLPEHAGSAP